MLWCPSCNWNVAPNAKTPTKVTRWQRMQRRLADGNTTRTLARAAQGKNPGDKASATAEWLTRLLALPVHLSTLVCVLGGVWLIVEGENWVFKALGIFLLLVALAVRPSLPKRPRHLLRLTRETSPALFRLAADIGQVTKAPLPDEILLTSFYVSGSARFGLRGRAIVIGAPMWVAASPEARIALMAHELGHFSHSDLNHGLWAGTAFDTLRKWHSAVTPAANPNPGITPMGNRGDRGLISFVQRIPMAVLGLAVNGYSGLLLKLNAPAHRRQEYDCDRDAVTAAGTDGALGMFDAILNRGGVEAAMSRAAVSKDRPDMWGTVRDQVGATPAVEIERRRRAAAAEQSRVDSMHPQTAIRMRVIMERPRAEAAVRPDADTWRAVDHDMSGPLATAAKTIGERIRYRH